MTGCEGYVEIRQHRIDRGPLCRRRSPRAAALAAAADQRARRAARPHHRRPYRDDRARRAIVSADEHQFRPVPAACRRRRPRNPTARGCAATRRRWRRSRRSAPARCPISIAGSPTTSVCCSRLSFHEPPRRRCRSLRRALERRRAAEARRVLHRRTRPLPHRHGRSRCGAAPARRGAVVVLHSGASPVRARTQGTCPGEGTQCRPRAALGGPTRAGARLHRRRGAASRQAAWRHRLFPLGQGRPCIGCIAPASATTISPRNRTGCAAATGTPISPTSSSRPVFRRRCAPVPDRGL